MSTQIAIIDRVNVAYEYLNAVVSKAGELPADYCSDIIYQELEALHRELGTFISKRRYEEHMKLKQTEWRI
jgi:hypothetical protein